MVDPSMTVLAQEGLRLEAEVERLQHCLASARDQGDQALIDEVEAVYDRAVCCWAEWQEVGSVDDQDVTGYLSLKSALTGTADGDPLDASERAFRLDCWNVFCAYVFQDGIANPYQAFKNLLAAVRRVSPAYLNGISQTDIGLLLGETKASPSAREIRRVETILKRWGVTGYHALGGTKTDKARRSSAKAAANNNNRSSGTKKKKIERRRDRRRRANKKNDRDNKQKP